MRGEEQLLRIEFCGLRVGGLPNEFWCDRIGFRWYGASWMLPLPSRS